MEHPQSIGPWSNRDFRRQDAKACKDFPLIPAEAGIQFYRASFWTPAFAGVSGTYGNASATRAFVTLRGALRHSL